MQECAGSVIVVLRELIELEKVAIARHGDKVIDEEDIRQYLRERPHGMKSRGIIYWVVERMQLANVPFFGGPPIPKVDVDDAAIGLPALTGINRKV